MEIDIPRSDGAPAGARRSPSPAALAAATAAVTAILLVACSGPEPGPAEPAADPSAQQAELDRLRSLPYVGFAERPSPGESDRVVELDAARAAPGHRLHTLRMLCRAELLDLGGRVVHAWQEGPPCAHWGHAEIVPGGDLLVVGRTTRGSPYLLRLDPRGERRWRLRPRAHHDVDLGPGGEILTITKAARRFRLEGQPVRIADDRITLIAAPSGGTRAVSLADLLAADGSRGAEGGLTPTTVRTSGLIDLLHANSVEWMDETRLFGGSPLYAPDHVLVSIRHQDLIAIVDWSAPRLVWAWGRGELEGPHDATLLESGNVLVFDNGITRGWSRVVEVDPRTDRIVWQYRADPPESFFSLTLGSAQRLPNGNTLVSHSDEGEAFEVTPAGEVVWRFRTPHRDVKGRRAAIVRMKLVAPERVAAVLAADAPDPD